MSNGAPRSHDDTNTNGGAGVSPRRATVTRVVKPDASLSGDGAPPVGRTPSTGAAAGLSTATLRARIDPTAAASGGGGGCMGGGGSAGRGSSGGLLGALEQAKAQAHQQQQ